MTIATIFSDAADGWIFSQAVTYADARSGTGGAVLTVFDTTTTLTSGQDGNPSCREAFVSFDTSSIGGGSTVSSVVLDLFLVIDNSTTDFTMNARDNAWGPTLTSGDYVAGASLSGSTLLASIFSSGIGATNAYKTLTSQAAFLTATNIKTGSVQILLCSSRQEGNNTPSGNEYLVFSAADFSGTTQDPKLTITYTISFSLPQFQHKPNQIWRRR